MRDDTCGIERDLSRSRGEAAEQIKREERPGAEAMLYVVAKDPQVEHVAEQMQISAVHEHGCYQRQVNRRRARMVRDLEGLPADGDRPGRGEIGSGRDFKRNNAPEIGRASCRARVNRAVM